MRPCGQPDGFYVACTVLPGVRDNSDFQSRKNIPWTAGFLVSTFLSMTFLEMAARTIPLGTAYAIWTGIGALG
ncbi:DMT family transporter [Robbsia betulipollinis]|uniref:DMT family transporter n=1 Tax=Robbsia betulipollinis TaxID=2981849 RepID=UPI0032C45439